MLYVCDGISSSLDAKMRLNIRQRLDDPVLTGTLCHDCVSGDISPACSAVKPIIVSGDISPASCGVPLTLGFFGIFFLKLRQPHGNAIIVILFDASS